MRAMTFGGSASRRFGTLSVHLSTVRAAETRRSIERKTEGVQNKIPQCDNDAILPKARSWHNLWQAIRFRQQEGPRIRIIRWLHDLDSQWYISLWVERAKRESRWNRYKEEPSREAATICHVSPHFSLKCSSGQRRYESIARVLFGR